MNTDWNSPQGDFDTAEKQGELLMLLSRQQVTVHTWDDPDFDYMEEQDLALVVQSPSGTEDLLIELKCCHHKPRSKCRNSSGTIIFI